VTLGATSIGLLGDSTASTHETSGGSTGGTSGGAPSDGTEGNGTDGSSIGGNTTSGTQVTAPVTAPVTLGATSIGLLGGSAASTGAPAEPGTDTAATPPGDHSDDVVGGSASGPGAAAGAQCAAQTVGFATTGQAEQLKAAGAGTAMSGANSGAQLAALALLCGSALLKLRRRSA